MNEPARPTYKAVQVAADFADQLVRHGVPCAVGGAEVPGEGFKLYVAPIHPITTWPLASSLASEVFTPHLIEVATDGATDFTADPGKWLAVFGVVVAAGLRIDWLRDGKHRASFEAPLYGMQCPP